MAVLRHGMQASSLVLCLFLSSAHSLSNIEGLTVNSLSFNPACVLGSPCWEIAITYRLSQGHWKSIFLSKTATLSDETKGFDPTSFPCHTGGDVRSSSICCLTDVLAEYHPLENMILRMERTLGESLETFGAGTCQDEEAIPAFGGMSGWSLPATEIDGNFLNLNSRIVPKRVVDADLGIYEAQILLDEAELRSAIGQHKEDTQDKYSVETFIGLVDFKPTATADLSPFHQQINIQLEKTDAYVAGSHYPQHVPPFIQGVQARMTQVMQYDSQRPTKRLHYVKIDITFAAAGYSAAGAGGMVALDSVAVGHDAGELHHPCTKDASQTAALTLQSTAEQVMAQACAPLDTMCASPSVAAGSAVSLSVPVDAGRVCVDCGRQIEVSFDLHVLSEGGQQRRSTVRVAVSSQPQYVLTLCDTAPSLAAADDMAALASLDLLVGGAASAAGFDALPLLENLAPVTESSWLQPLQHDASSLEGGLLSLVLGGDEEWFGRHAQAELVLEDLLSLHFLEPAAQHPTFDRVAALARAPPPPQGAPAGVPSKGAAASEAPTVEVSAALAVAYDTVDNRFHLTPSHALLDLCPLSPKPGAGAVLVGDCVARWDVSRGRAVPRPWPSPPSALRVEPLDGHSWEHAAAFLQATGHGAAVDGEAWAARLWEARGLAAGRYRQGWWVSAGYQWAGGEGEASFVLSQRVLLLALVAVQEQGAPRRALLASMESVGQQVRGAAVAFETSADKVAAAALAAPPELVARVRVGLALGAEEACLPLAELRGAQQQRLAELMAGVASALQTTQLLSLHVDRGAVRCEEERRRAEATEAAASVDAEVLVVFVAAAAPFLDLDKLAAAPGVLSVKSTSLPPHVLLSDPSAPTVAPPPAAAGAERQEGQQEAPAPSQSNAGAIVGAVMGAVAACGVAGGVVWWRRRRSNAAEQAAGGRGTAEEEEREGREGGMLPEEASAGSKSAAYHSKLEVAGSTSPGWLEKGAEAGLPDIWFSTRSDLSQTDDAASDTRSTADRGDAV